MAVFVVFVVADTAVVFVLLYVLKILNMHLSLCFYVCDHCNTSEFYDEKEGGFLTKGQDVCYHGDVNCGNFIGKTCVA